MSLTFVGPAAWSASLQQSPPSLRASGGPQREAPNVNLGAKAYVVACGLAAAAGVATASKRRAARKAEAQEIAVLPPHMQPGSSWKHTPMYIAGAGPEGLLGDWKTPAPGSELALQTMVGADVEVGDGKPWDPLGMAKLYDRNFDFNENMVYPHVCWLREAELKHGRVAMLAFVGILTAQVVQFPGYPKLVDWTKALDVCYAQKTSLLGAIQIWTVIGLLEGKFFPNDAYIGQMDREPGDLGFDPLKFSKAPNFDMKAMQLKELKNGRLAMIGVAALGAAHSIPGSVPGMAALSSDSAAKAADSRSTAFCGETRPAPQAIAEAGASKTASRYTTQKILPALSWLKSGLTAKDIDNSTVKAVTIGGNDILIGKTEVGKLFAVGNLCPHIGTPMSEGADVIGDVIVCPLHGSSFKTTTGELIDWCVSPPIIGPLTGLIVEKKNLLIFECREGGFLGGGEIEVLVDTNAKKAYEAYFWKGVLDAQGKDDGTFY